MNKKPYGCYLHASLNFRVGEMESSNLVSVKCLFSRDYARKVHKNKYPPAIEQVRGIFLCKDYKKDIFAVLLTGFEPHKFNMILTNYYFSMRRIIKIQTAERIKDKIKYNRYGKSTTRVKNKSNPLKIQLIAMPQILQRQKPTKRATKNCRNNTMLFSLALSLFLFFI